MNQVTVQAMKKSEVVKLFNKFSEKTVRYEMLNAIQERRNILFTEITERHAM
jgi:hypothetical protein